MKEHHNYNYDQIFDIVTFLQDNNIDFNMRNKIGYTPLKISINNKWNQLSKILIIKSKDKIFTEELLQETYGGKLTLLSKVGDLLAKQELPVREK